MLHLRKVSFFANFLHATQYVAFGFITQRLPSCLFNQARSDPLAPVDRSLTIKNISSFSSQKQLSQADADYIKRLDEQVGFYFSVKDYDQARKVLMLVTQFFLKNGQTGLEYAQALSKIGQSYRLQEKMTDALDYFQRAVRVLDNLEGNLDVEKALIQPYIAEILFAQQKFNQAEKLLLECAQVLKKTTIRLELCTALGLLGLLNQHKQKYEDAIRFFATQLVILRQFFQLKGMYAIMSIHSLAELTRIYVQTKKFEQALASCLQAKRLYESEGLQKSNEYAVNLVNLAYIHQSLNQKQQYFDCYEKALAIQSVILEKDNPELISMLLRLGLEYFYAEKPDQALPHLQRFLQVQSQLPNEKRDRKYPNILLAVAIIHRNKDNCTEALKYYQQSLDIQANHGPLENVAMILKQMTETHFQLQDLTSSLDCAFRCLAAYKKLYGEKSSKNAEIYSIIAIIYQSMGNQAENLKFVEMAQSVLGDQTKAENK